MRSPPPAAMRSVKCDTDGASLPLPSPTSRACEMDEWRERLRTIVADWGLSPEEQSGIIDELEQHLEQEFTELRSRVGDVAAQEQILAEVNDPVLREMSVRSRHHAEPSV